ncbi:hypothetical protein D0Z03_002449 [Geotrichum reessii]|nr:hypothetical protein D0Z03_002449 [Galactomyces reessii]
MEQKPVKVIVSNPQKLTASEGAKRAAKLRTQSNDMGPERPTPESSLKKDWSPVTWQDCPIVQDVVYSDYNKVETALEKLESLPPLVHPREIEQLKKKLKAAAEGEAFLLQGGDCAELFDYCTQDNIENKLKVLLQMSLVLIWGIKLPVVRIGRMAGQYAKPRSKLTEMVDGKEINSFRGDNINGFDVNDRTPDPNRLVSSYFHSAATLNFIRSSLQNGLADLRRPGDWDLSHVRSDKVRQRYEEIVTRIIEGLEFMKTVGADDTADITSIDFYSSHEALLLEYEQSLTRLLRNPTTGEKNYYNTSAHFIWIGDRTRQLDHAHVEFFRGVANPIGIKVGPTMEADELVRLLDIVDPDFVTGRVTLISRYGAEKIEKMLPPHILAVQKSKHKVVWVSDPCHGNTKTSPVTKVKTRYFDDIITEVKLALQVHKNHGSKLNGVHLELTGDAVTECIGGSQALEDEDLVIRYDTVCDPRLSVSQSLDVAFVIADWYKSNLGNSVDSASSN